VVAIESVSDTGSETISSHYRNFGGITHKEPLIQDGVDVGTRYDKYSDFRHHVRIVARGKIIEPLEDSPERDIAICLQSQSMISWKRVDIDVLNRGLTSSTNYVGYGLAKGKIRRENIPIPNFSNSTDSTNLALDENTDFSDTISLSISWRDLSTFGFKRDIPVWARP
jgi:hypothetical protein